MVHLKWDGKFLSFFQKQLPSLSKKLQKDIKYSENMIKYIKIVLLFMKMHDKMVLNNVNEKKGVEDERTVIG